ncbi:hypothetical protein PVAP13_4KG357000 [Panicum virgatum]|uniref:X8 domain-containing protein n=1 Tax=Panicum virgatum TaxID=38727 RepID=A0A8T0U002_PANVG|nr:hypothetical protein PVAP13_4KG357000 [Panicum virgatum]
MIIKNYFIFIEALIIFMQYDWADGASMSKTGKYSPPNLVNSPTLPPFKDLIGGGGGPSTGAANGVPPPPYCLYPPHAKPAMPAPLPPMASPPGASPPAGSPSIAPGIISPPGASPPAGSPTTSITLGGSPPPLAFMPPVAFPEPPPRGPPGLWCVANPKAASAVVQTAMDYTCGSGADCGTAAPGGQCYLPDTLATHASYAFNSYWQRTKAAGGTCNFAGASGGATWSYWGQRTR